MSFIYLIAKGFEDSFTCGCDTTDSVRYHLRANKLAPRGAWLRQKSCQEISCTVVALLVLKKCVSSDAL